MIRDLLAIAWSWLPTVHVRLQVGDLAVLYPVELDDEDDCDHDEHLSSEDCPCDPTCVPVERANGEIAFLHAHQLEPDATVEDQADRAVAIFEGIAMAREDDE